MQTAEKNIIKKQMALVLSAVYLLISLSLVFFLPPAAHNAKASIISGYLPAKNQFRSYSVKNFLKRTDKIFSGTRKPEFTKKNDHRGLNFPGKRSIKLLNIPAPMLTDNRARIAQNAGASSSRNCCWLI